MPPQLLRNWGHKNGVNIVELWSEDYIHVDKLPLNL